MRVTDMHIVNDGNELLLRMDVKILTDLILFTCYGNVEDVVFR